MAKRKTAPQADYERYLTSVSAAVSALSLGGADGLVERCLAGLVELVGADRASFYQIEDGSGAVRLTHTWARIGLPLAPRGDFRRRWPWYAAEARAGRDVICRTADLPLEATRERTYARSAGLSAIAMIPVRIWGRVAVAISVGIFRPPDAWPPAPAEKLRLIGEVLGNALARDQAHNRLRVLETRLARLEKGASAVPALPGRATLRHAMRTHITAVLDQCEWRIKGAGGAAQVLDLPPSSVRFQMKKLGIERP